MTSTAARDEAEESVRLSRRIANPSQLAIALTALGSSLLDSDPSAALAALDESIAITDSGASDVMLATSLAKAAVARAALGQSTESLDLLGRSIRHSVFCGDVPSIVLTLAHGLTVITDFARPELLIRWAATIEQSDYRISDPQRVHARARRGASRRDRRPRPPRRDPRDDRHAQLRRGRRPDPARARRRDQRGAVRTRWVRR